MANTKVTGELIADNAIKAIHIDETATGVTLADLKVSDSQSGSDVALRIQNSATTTGDTATLRFSVTSNGSFDSAFVGSDRNNDLILGANAAERVRIDYLGNLQLKTSSAELYLADDSQIRCLDDFHRIRFRRSENILELVEYGNILFTTGAPSSEKARIDSTGVLQFTESSANGYINANGTDFEIDINRHPETGVFSDASKGHARILLRSEDNGPGSRITFHTASSAFTTASEIMRIDSAGNVGINKLNPSSAGYGKRLWISSVSGGEPEGQIYLEGNRSLAGQNVGAITFVNNGGFISGISGMTDDPNISNSGALTFFNWNNGTYKETMRIKSSGNVGISNSGAFAKLTVDLDGNSNGDVIDWSSNQVVFNRGGSSRSHGIGFSIDLNAGTSTISSLTPAISWRDLHFRANNHTFFGNGATEVLKIKANGDLDINGNKMWPVVNVSRVNISNGSTTISSSGSYTNIGPTVSYTPKQAGNVVMVYHGCQTWYGSTLDGSGDIFVRFLVNGSEVWENSRATGNMDADSRRQHLYLNSIFTFTASNTSAHTINFQAYASGTVVDGFNFYHTNANANQFIFVEYQV